MKNLPKTFLKTRDSLYLHIKILWGLVHKKAVPQAPCPDSLKEFYNWFTLVTEVEDAANNEAAPQLISATEIKSLCNMRSGQIKIGKGIVNVKQFFTLYIQATLAWLGIHQWAPNLNNAPDSLYNKACRVSAIKTFCQVVVLGAYKFMNCSQRYINQIGLLTQAYNHYIHFHQAQKFICKLKEDGNYQRDLER